MDTGVVIGNYIGAYFTIKVSKNTFFFILRIVLSCVGIVLLSRPFF